MKEKLTPRRLLLLIAGLLALVVLASPLFFAPYRQADYCVADEAPLNLEAAQRVELNTADEEALCTLPGIGPKKAQAIIEYRRVHGPFANLREVEQVRGIAEKTLQSWGSLAWVDPGARESE